MDSLLPLVEYLLDSSRQSTNTLRLQQLNQVAEARRDAREKFDKWIKAEALTLVTELFLEYGEDIVVRAAEKLSARADVAAVAKDSTKGSDQPCTEIPAPRPAVDKAAPIGEHTRTPFRPPHRIYRKIYPLRRKA